MRNQILTSQDLRRLLRLRQRSFAIAGSQERSTRRNLSSLRGHPRGRKRGFRKAWPQTGLSDLRWCDDDQEFRAGVEKSAAGQRGRREEEQWIWQTLIAKQFSRR